MEDINISIIESGLGPVIIRDANNRLVFAPQILGIRNISTAKYKFLILDKQNCIIDAQTISCLDDDEKHLERQSRVIEGKISSNQGYDPQRDEKEIIETTMFTSVTDNRLAEIKFDKNCVPYMIREIK
ncbi:MAG: hypothetical protein K2N91_02610 [Muribaculaceae bacterium]|nr:hypothetical protein [Muribaculaceae bacterium]